MKTSFLIQYLEALTDAERELFSRFLQSPYHNQRMDVVRLYQLLLPYLAGEADLPSKESLYAEIYGGRTYANLEFNNTITYLTQCVRNFLCIERFQSEKGAQDYYLLQALRDHHLDHQFERQWQRAVEAHRALPERNAQWYLREYNFQNEWFKYKRIKTSVWPENLQATSDALTRACSLEVVRWGSTGQAWHQATGQQLSLPLLEAAQATLKPEPQLGAYELFAQTNRVLEPTSTVSDFDALRALMRNQIRLLSLEERREVYLAAINFCIRQINQGERSFMHQAMELYKEGLESKALLVRGNALQPHTYYNVHVLAHRVGEREWAKHFIDTYQAYLPKAERENFYQYNLAIYSFMLEDYKSVLGILLNVRFNELYLNLEVRTMMLRAYFETRELHSLQSLLASFSLFVRRHQELGHNKQRYLNLIKYTKHLLKLNTYSLARKRALLNEVIETKALSDKEWIVRKLEASVR